MFIYYLILIFLSLLSFQEIYKPKPLNLFSFIFLTIFFSLFIGLRNEIGCDWEGYKKIFELTNCIPNIGNNQCDTNSISNTFDYLRFKEVGFSSLNFIVKKFGGNYYYVKYISSLFFVIPLLYFCSNLKRPFLAILISYPYLITVIGLASIRQSIAIGFLMVCITELKRNKFYTYYLYNFLGNIFHYSSVIFIFLPLLIQEHENYKLEKLKKALIILLFIFIFLSLFFNNNYLIHQLNGYFNYPKILSIKSPLIIWIMITIPSATILLNYKYFKSDDKNKFWRNYSIIGILMFFSIFFNKIIALRFLLYFIPIKIYAFSNITEIKIFHKSKRIVYLAIILLSFSFLTIWLNFANHSYCYLPYKNLLLRY